MSGFTRHGRPGAVLPDGRLSRTIGVGVVVSLGAAEFALQLVHLAAVRSAASAYAGVLPPTLMSIAVVVGGAWLHRSDFDGRHVLRAAAWCLLTAAVFVLIQVVYVSYQVSAGGVIVSPFFDVVGSMTVGSLLGLVLGGYDARRLAAYEHLETARDRADRLNQQLRVVNRVLRHDFRNDLAVVRGHVDLLADGEDDEAVDSLRVVREKVEEMAARSEMAGDVEAILEEAGSPTDRVDLVDVVEDEVVALRRDHPEATVETDLPDSAPASASTLVDSAVRNVVENAIVHGGDDPAVRVTIDGGGETVSLRVADDGPGIPPGEIAVLESGEETPLRHASGLGLWLVNWIVEASDGSVAFEENEPRGSVVTLRFESSV